MAERTPVQSDGVHRAADHRLRRRRARRVAFPARVPCAQGIRRPVHNARAAPLHVQPQRSAAREVLHRHHILSAVDGRHLADCAGQPAAGRQREVRRIHAAHVARETHPIGHTAVHDRRLQRALPRHRRHHRYVRIQSNLTRARQLHDIGIRPAGRGPRRDPGARIQVQGPAKRAHRINFTGGVHRQPIPAVVRGSTPALRPPIVAGGSQLEQKRIFTSLRSRRVRRARPRVQIHRAAERAQQVHPARRVQHQRLHLVGARAAQLSTPHVATIRIQAHDKPIVLSARGQRRRARSGIEVRRAVETARHGHVPARAHGERGRGIVARSAERTGPAQGTRRTKLCDETIRAASRGQHLNFRRAVEIHDAPENARHVNIVRDIDRDRIDLLVFGAAHHGHPLQAAVTVEFQ